MPKSTYAMRPSLSAKMLPGWGSPWNSPNSSSWRRPETTPARVQVCVHGERACVCAWGACVCGVAWVWMEEPQLESTLHPPPPPPHTHTPQNRRSPVRMNCCRSIPEALMDSTSVQLGRRKARKGWGTQGEARDGGVCECVCGGGGARHADCMPCPSPPPHTHTKHTRLTAGRQSTPSPGPWGRRGHGAPTGSSPEHRRESCYKSPACGCMGVGWGGRSGVREGGARVCVRRGGEGGKGSGGDKESTRAHTRTSMLRASCT